MQQLFMRFPYGKPKAFTLSYDDGVEQDIRLIEIMRANGLKGTFNLNSGEYPAEGTVFPKGQVHRRLTYSQASRVYCGPDVEVAVHGLHHLFHEQLPTNRTVGEIAHDRENLEAQFGVTVRGMAHPFGTFSDDVIRVLDDCGICYSRTVRQTESFAIPTDWLRLDPTCHHDNPRLDELCDKFCTLQTKRGPALFYVWGHSYEFERNGNWEVIEKFAQKIGGHDDVWYVTNIEIYDYVQAFNRLIFSMDGSRVYNPSACSVWGLCGDKVCEIPGGAQLKLG